MWYHIVGCPTSPTLIFILWYLHFMTNVTNMKEYSREICYTSLILTKYQTVSALHWLSATKYQPLLSYIDPVHTVSSSRNAQLNQLDLVVVAFTHMLVCAGLQTDPFERLVVFCTRGLKQIGLKWNFSSFLSTICYPSHITNIRITDWLTDELKGVGSNGT